MRLYNSFLVRCWLMRGAPEGGRSVLDIEHIQTGERFRPSSLSEAEGWMYEALHRSEQSAPCAHGPAAPAEDSDG